MPAGCRRLDLRPHQQDLVHHTLQRLLNVLHVHLQQQRGDPRKGRSHSRCQAPRLSGQRRGEGACDGTRRGTVGAARWAGVLPCLAWRSTHLPQVSHDLFRLLGHQSLSLQLNGPPAENTSGHGESGPAAHQCNNTTSPGCGQGARDNRAASPCGNYTALGHLSMQAGAILQHVHCTGASNGSVVPPAAATAGPPASGAALPGTPPAARQCLQE